MYTAVSVHEISGKHLLICLACSLCMHMHLVMMVIHVDKLVLPFLWSTTTTVYIPKCMLESISMHYVGM